MGWFDRQAQGLDPVSVAQEHGRYLRAAGVDTALEAIAGPYGCRRFVVRFHHRGGRVRLKGVEAVPLSWGGGPPPDDPRGTRFDKLVAALDRLHANMALGPTWDRGALAYLRDAEGRTEIIPTFDDDADAVYAADLPVPGPPGHPLEAPETRALLARAAPALGRVLSTTRGMVTDWDWWEIDDDVRLTLHWDGPPERSLVHRCRVLATFEPERLRFQWRTPEPLGSALVFQSERFAATVDAAMELAMLATVEVGGAWLLAQPYDDRGSQLLAAVYR